MATRVTNNCGNILQSEEQNKEPLFTKHKEWEFINYLRIQTIFLKKCNKL